MSRLRQSQLTDVVTVHAGASHRAIAPGEIVDFDELVGDETLETQLGDLAQHFSEATAPPAEPANAPADEQES